ncbi:MAG: T9SS type A sorting domain-containing protein [Bacteroidetes bacterium]|nr:T9SS type A sorting domain-containing protein [Bacteroidota bacterium]
MKNFILIVLVLCCVGGKAQCDVFSLYSQAPKGYARDESLYHDLRYNKIIREKYYNDWYNNMTATTNLGRLENVLETLLNGNYKTARKILNGIAAANKVEENSIKFYNLYANYFQTVKEGTRYSPNDSLTLLNMAHLCFNEYGTNIYRARELYNSLYKTVVKYEDCKCFGEGTGLTTPNTNTKTSNSKLKDRWRIDLFPNPAQNKITLKSKNETEDLQVEITDVMGRKLVNTRVKIKDYTTDMDVDLLNGVYFIRFTNTEGKINVKKLTIAK